MKWFKYILGFLGAVESLLWNKAKSEEVKKLKKVIDEKQERRKES